MDAYPLRLEPILKPRVWGGRRLARLGKNLPEGATIGESWEVADLPDEVRNGRSVIANGPLRRRTLREAVTEHKSMIMGRAAVTDDGGFPLLLKYLDARENLSVQVHPTPGYVEGHPEARLKTEAWIVIDAEPGAVIYNGLRPGVTAESFSDHVRTGDLVGDLRAVPVRVGDCHHVPSGTVHALGSGVLVAEVQTPSDTTFRLYDWDRTGRPLHIEQALSCIDFGGGPGEVATPSHPIQVDGILSSRLLETEFFSIERIVVLPDRVGEELAITTNDLPMIWMVTGGQGRVIGGGVEVELGPGQTVLLPAALEGARAELEGGCSLLEVSLPSPIRNMIA